MAEKKKRILIAGATGDLGMEIVKLLCTDSNELRLLTRSQKGVKKLSKYSTDIWNVDAEKDIAGLKGIGEGVDVFISALGKSLSLFKPNKDNFIETDFKANKNILNAIKGDGVSRIIYVSIKDADKAQHFEIAKAHKLFEEEIQASGIPYTIVRPVGLYSGLNDLAIMAKRNVIPIVGDGQAKTNSIHHCDLAKTIVSFVDDGPEFFEPGGPLIHTRMEMAEMLKEKIGAEIVKIPEPMAELGMMIPNFLNDTMSDKLDFYKHVITNDMIGEKCGKITFQEYLEQLDLSELP
jgi:uncharacterized protein YbjT (DUF2867 family)